MYKRQLLIFVTKKKITKKSEWKKFVPAAAPVSSCLLYTSFVTGSSFSHGGPNKYNSDAKFQISLRYRLIQGVLPYNTYLFLTYTQKSFWEIYRKSKPFSDNNYNPTLGLGNLLRKNGKAVGLVMLQYEHESNGRDSIWSRSWNRISLLGQIFFSRNWSMEVKLWAPFSLDDPNRDIVYYNGYGLVAANYKSDNERLWLSACITTVSYTHLILSLGYLHETVEEWIAKTPALSGFEFVYSVESEPLGTGGAVKQALAQATGNEVLILNGDTLFDADIEALVAAHRQRGAALSMALKPMEHFDRYGTVTTDGEGRVTAFHEKRFCTQGTINGGVYILQTHNSLFDGKMCIRDRSKHRNPHIRFLSSSSNFHMKHVAILGCVGIPANYGGYRCV